ncbi:glutathione S-transferase 1-like [Uranotaenia lowii]|uniref:glutathione S-transferase 1-like n=1 Tax=Uranotaenia lowii TaxID=190385 RepID=UPI00247906F3|nr:glutathione S-transferase 1-like [Uranotaenia lowii]
MSREYKSKIIEGKAPITLYTTRRSPKGRAVEIVARLLDLDLKTEYINLANIDHLTPEYLKINPQDTVPTIVDDGVALYDSHAINVYLISKYAKNEDLYPRKDLITQARINALLHFESGVLFSRLRATLVPFFYHGAKKIPSENLEGFQAYEFLEATLKGKFLVGGSLTLADISICTTLSTANYIVPIDGQRFPKLVNYLKDLEQNQPWFGELNTDRNIENFATIKKIFDENS